MHRPSLVSFVLALAVAGVFSGLAALRAGGAEETPHPKTFAAKFLFVTRHCEKDAQGDPRDGGLSEIGKKRAAALAKLLEPAGVRHVFSSEYKRAQETAAPVAKPGIELRTISAGKSDELYKEIDALPSGETALVVGHSNTVPQILAHLGVDLETKSQLGPVAVESLAEDDFGSLFVVTIPKKGSGAGARFVKLHYGD